MNELAYSKLAALSRRSAFLSILGAVIVLLALAYSAYKLQRSEADLTRTEQQLKERVATLSLINEQVEDAKQQLAALKTTIEQIPAGNRPADLKSSVDKLDKAIDRVNDEASTALKGKIILTYYASQISKNVYESTKKLLDQEGFAKIDAKPFSVPPAYLEKDCTVIYYDENNRGTARELAAQLSTATGYRFKVLKGNVFKEIKGQEAIRLFIHHVTCSTALP